MTTPLEKWVEEQAQLAKPAGIHWCDGTEEEARWLMETGMTKEKVEGQPIFHPDQKTFPNSYLHRSHPTDVARTENLTYICLPGRETAGPNNNWMEPGKAKDFLRPLSDGCMAGKTMYVLPYMMGHPDSPLAKPCVQLTDSSYSRGRGYGGGDQKISLGVRLSTSFHKFDDAKIPPALPLQKGGEDLSPLF